MMEAVADLDGERDRVVRELTRHCGDGRLTLDELEDRIAEAYAATTRTELDHALREMPKPAVITPPAERRSPGAGSSRHPGHQVKVSLTAQETIKGAELALRVHLVVYLSVIGLLFAIWFLTTPFGYPWPMWPATTWGVALAIHAGVTKAVIAAHGD
jgi:hypothetical protein